MGRAWYGSESSNWWPNRAAAFRGAGVPGSGDIVCSPSPPCPHPHLPVLLSLLSHPLWSNEIIAGACVRLYVSPCQRPRLPEYALAHSAHDTLLTRSSPLFHYHHHLGVFFTTIHFFPWSCLSFFVIAPVFRQRASDFFPCFYLDLLPMN
jgi:hypothetical protein